MILEMGNLRTPLNIDETIPIVGIKECEENSLVTYGVRFDRICHCRAWAKEHRKMLAMCQVQLPVQRVMLVELRDLQAVRQYQGVPRPNQIDGISLLHASMGIICLSWNVVVFIAVGITVDRVS
jgi:hypothetical protein